jgi:hypothetical protein
MFNFERELVGWNVGLHFSYILLARGSEYKTESDGIWIHSYGLGLLSYGLDIQEGLQKDIVILLETRSK